MFSRVNNQISPCDQVFATIENNGHIIASVNKNNFRSTDDVVRTILSLAGSFLGVAQVNIRNKSQGWTENRAICLA